MKKLVFRMLILLVAAVLVTGCGKKEEKSAGAAAEGYTGYASLDPDPAEAIAFDGRTVKWAGQTFTLGEDTYFLDYRLDAAQIAGNPYAFRDIGDALRALKNGTAEKPMTLLIAPGVYWVENFGAEGGTDSLWCTERAIHVDCDYLTLYGLSHEPENVVLGIEHQRAEDDYCSNARFGMFVADGSGLRCENLTIGSYGTLALDYALAPELSREKQVTDANLQQMLFSPNADGIAINCCFEGYISLYWFAEYYKECRMQKGCRVDAGACVGCELEMDAGYFTNADMFDCEITLAAPIIEKVSYYGKMEYLTTEKGLYQYRLWSWAGTDGRMLDKDRPEMHLLVWREMGELSEWYLAGPEGTTVSAEIVTCTEQEYQILLGRCAEMGLKAEVVSEGKTDPAQQEAFNQKVAAMQQQIDATKSPVMKKRLQKKLDEILQEAPQARFDVLVERAYVVGTRGVLLTDAEISAILAWENQPVNSGKRVLLPCVDIDLTNGYNHWYQVDENRKPVIDENGNLVDAYHRDENGEMMWKAPAGEDDWSRVGAYHYFEYLYGITLNDLFTRLPNIQQYVVDTDILLGEELKNLPFEIKVSLVEEPINYWNRSWGYILLADNLTVEGMPVERPNSGQYTAEALQMFDGYLEGLRVQQGDEILYNFMGIYGEDPFGAAE